MTRSCQQWLDDPDFQSILAVLSKGRWAEDGELDEALRLVGAWQIEHPQDPVLLVCRGRIAARWGRLSEARDFYHRAQEIADPAAYSSPWLNEASLYDDFGLPRKVVALCDHILAAMPTEARASELRAISLGKRRSVARQHGLTREDATSGDPFVLDTLELLLAMGVDVKEVKTRVTDQLGLLREIDILAEIRSPHFLGRLPLVVECKDWSRPVDRPVVDKYVALADHSKYKLCAIVAREFTRDATRLAAESGIWLVTRQKLEASLESYLWTKLEAEPICDRYPDFFLAGVPAGETEEEREREARGCLKSSLIQEQTTRSVTVQIRREGVYVDETLAIPLQGSQSDCLKHALHILGEVPLFVKILYLSYHERIHRHRCVDWAR